MFFGEILEILFDALEGVLGVQEAAQLQASHLGVDVQACQELKAHILGDEFRNSTEEGLLLDVGASGNKLHSFIKDSDAVSAHLAKQVLVYVLVAEDRRVQRRQLEPGSIHVQ